MPQMQGNNPMQGMNPMQIMQQFQQFAKGMTPQGAKAQVEQMLQSGKISQAQLNQAMEMAKGIKSMFGK